VEVGIDGKAVTLQPPLHFISRPRALTVRLPLTASRRPPAARVVRMMATPALVAVAGPPLRCLSGFAPHLRSSA
jgi:hypothetical protein